MAYYRSMPDRSSVLSRKTLAGLRVARQLVAHPSALRTIGCLRSGSTGWDNGEPWWNARAIDYLSEQVSRGSTAFEWGSGGSTVFLAGLGVEVTSIEHDPEWVAQVLERCPGADVRLVPGTTSGVLRSEPVLRDRGRHFFDAYVAEVDQVADESLDLVIVDGLCRVECVRRARPKVKAGGLLVVDDSDLRFLAGLGGELPGWRRVSLTGFKRPFDVRQTSFFRKPG